MSNQSHSEMVKHIRARIKAAGINVSVRKMICCGVRSVAVAGATYEQVFTSDDHAKINLIAKSNGLTLSRGVEIEIDKPFQAIEYSMP